MAIRRLRLRKGTDLMNMIRRVPTFALFFGASFLFGPVTGKTDDVLEEVQRLETSAARDATLFTMEGTQYLAIPQMAEDVPGTEANMNGGNSDVDSLVFVRRHGKFEVFQRIPSHGGEDAEYFSTGGKSYLAICGVRSGSDPYNASTYAVIYAFDGKRFYPVQNLPTFAAKQCRWFTIGERRFLAIANGVTAEGISGDPNSQIYEWIDGRFEPFQAIPSRWGYNWTFFEEGGETWLVFVDHLDGWTLYRWTGAQFEAVTNTVETGARAMTHFRIDGDSYFAYANILGTSRIYRFEDGVVEKFQAFEGAGGREFHFFEADDERYLVRINFISGERTAPVTALQSQVYRWDGTGFAEAQSLPTFGGTDADSFTDGSGEYVVVSNSLSEDIRFRVDSVVYRVRD